MTTEGRCVIPECSTPVDPNRVVEMAIVHRPYKELRDACPAHLAGFEALGLPVHPKAGPS